MLATILVVNVEPTSYRVLWIDGEERDNLGVGHVRAMQRRRRGRANLRYIEADVAAQPQWA